MRKAAIKRRGHVLKLTRRLMRGALQRYQALKDPRVVRRLNRLLMAIF